MKSFQTPLLLAVTFILVSACGDNYKILILRWEHKENEQVRPTQKMYAALVQLPVNKAEEGWLMIMENVPKNVKFTLFLNYMVEL